jgi:hypothetical protein
MQKNCYCIKKARFARQTVERLSPKPKRVDDLIVVMFLIACKTVVAKVKMKDQIENKLRGYILCIPTPFCQNPLNLVCKC